MGILGKSGLVDGSTMSVAPASTTNQAVTPTSGQTVQVADASADVLLVINPAGVLGALTIALPSEAKSVVGQKVTIVSLKAITLMSITGATTILNAPLSLALGAAVVLQKVLANTWVKL